MSEQNSLVYNTICKQLKEYQTSMGHLAVQVIADDATRHLFLDGAVHEVCDALSVVHGLSLGNACLEVDLQPLNSELAIPIAISDAIGESGLLLTTARLCKDNGILPYHIIEILAHALLTKDAAIFQDYARYYGLKSAISKFCGLALEPELAQLIADLHDKLSAGIVDAPEKIALMKRAYHEGFNNEKQYKGCAQCTLLTMFSLFGRENAVLFQSASALAAGMAHSGDGTCGGYSGGILYLGSIVGRRLDHLEDGDNDAKNTAYHLAQMLRDRYIVTYGSVICLDVHQQIFGQSFCLRTDAVKKEFDAAGAHTTKCTTVIGTVCAWLAEIIYDCGYATPATE
jgi:hypothetical protein